MHYRLTSSSSDIALTFDDGPDPESTLRVAEILEAHGVRGAFFLLGSKVEKFPDIARRLLSGNHLICNHSYSHRWKNAWSRVVLRGEIERSQAVFREILGVSPRFFRPPRGLLAPWLRGEVEAAGLETVMWTLMPGDYYFWHREARIERRVRKGMKPGTILVLHDGLNLEVPSDRKATLKALDRLLPWLEESGIRCRRLDEGLNRPGYLTPLS